MVSTRILVLGGTGMLGRPVVHCLRDQGHTVRIFTRDVRKTQHIFGDTVEIAEGTVMNKDDIRAAATGSDAVHINLSPATEYTAMRHVVDLADSQVSLNASPMSPPLHLRLSKNNFLVLVVCFEQEITEQTEN